MTFIIPADVFARLSVAALRSGPDEEIKSPIDMLRSVRVEHRNGKRLVVASNHKILVCELIDKNVAEPDGSVNITLDLINPCNLAMANDGRLEINIVSESWAVATITTGYFYPGNAMVIGQYPEWRGLIPETPKKAVGSIVFNPDDLALMARAAPSGRIVLPRLFDDSQPIICRDTVDPNWLGVFLSKSDGIEPATVPEWIK
jgi:hypothetical protein